MIKYLKYMFVAAVMMIAAAGCQEDIEESFSKTPKASELNSTGTILMTQNTMAEDIVWSWTAARFLKGEVSYKLYVQYAEEEAKQVGEATKDLNLRMTKPDFRSLLGGFSSIPVNSSFDLVFYVVATDELDNYVSEKVTTTVYSYGDAVSSVVTAEQASVVLDINSPTESLQLLSWTEARLVYGEAITYSVYISYGEGELVEVASGLTDMSCARTVDEWNEAAVAAGAPEAAASDLKFTVFAFSKSYPDGVPSEVATINITTYIATYPDQLYVPGSHQGWSPEKAASIPQSTLTKGLFECYMDLTTADGADVEFKFAPEAAWGNDFGIGDAAVVTTDGDGNTVVTATLNGSNNVKAPSGFYRISVNKKLNTLEMVKITSMGLIGDATPGGWDSETKMVYDAATNTYSATLTMGTGSYKFRANNNWTYSIGDNGSFTGGDNFAFDKAEGEYKVVLDVNKHPYPVKVLSTLYPEELYMIGSEFGNWSWSSDGIVDMIPVNGTSGSFWTIKHFTAGEGFKWCSVKDWNGDFAELGSKEGYTVDGGNALIAESGLYMVYIDMGADKITIEPAKVYGMGDCFGGWDEGTHAFATSGSKMSFTTTGAGELRMYASSSAGPGSGNWWKAEFIIIDGKIVYRGNGGDQERVSVEKGKKVTLDFSNNTGTIE
ncbi:SusF/SusE family outer membrane protein [Dysgonomonas sp. 521]|uniref:SusF/SusE family outer membrane protein n=1 Tax=Dysgonomonas sp. 521 TaxID=2302932 RepID=UPI0013D7CA5F|nr:SusF/SusE family outer membrane protein [Dysgonomonas sp. 521]